MGGWHGEKGSEMTPKLDKKWLVTKTETVVVSAKDRESAYRVGLTVIQHHGSDTTGVRVEEMGSSPA